MEAAARARSWSAPGREGRVTVSEGEQAEECCECGAEPRDGGNACDSCLDALCDACAEQRHGFCSLCDPERPAELERQAREEAERQV